MIEQRRQTRKSPPPWLKGMVASERVVPTRGRTSRGSVSFCSAGLGSGSGPRSQLALPALVPSGTAGEPKLGGRAPSANAHSAGNATDGGLGTIPVALAGTATAPLAKHTMRKLRNVLEKYAIGEGTPPRQRRCVIALQKRRTKCNRRARGGRGVSTGRGNTLSSHKGCPDLTRRRARGHEHGSGGGTVHFIEAASVETVWQGPRCRSMSWCSVAKARVFPAVRRGGVSLTALWSGAFKVPTPGIPRRPASKRRWPPCSHAQPSRGRVLCQRGGGAGGLGVTHLRTWPETSGRGSRPDRGPADAPKAIGRRAPELRPQSIPRRPRAVLCAVSPLGSAATTRMTRATAGNSSGDSQTPVLTRSFRLLRPSETLLKPRGNHLGEAR